MKIVITERIGKQIMECRETVRQSDKEREGRESKNIFFRLPQFHFV